MTPHPAKRDEQALWRFGRAGNPRPRRAANDCDGRERGFSLLELLMALTILAITFLSIAQLIAIGTRANMSARLLSQSTAIAQRAMADLEAIPFDLLASEALPTYYNEHGEPVASTDATQRFQRTVTVTGVNTRLKQVTITVVALRTAYGRTPVSTRLNALRTKIN